MKLSYCSLLLLVIISSPGGLVTAQKDNVVETPVKVSIPSVSLVGFAGSDAHLTNTPGKRAEQIITPSIRDTTWLNYSSIVDEKSANVISVNINSGNLPAEVVVKLNVGEDVGAGAGTMGKSAGQITLSEYPQAIITDIGSCYTGQGSKKGHPLTYSWEWPSTYDVNHPSIDNIEVSVIYTLTAGK
ncbi:MAG: hypothetical protein PHR38_08195 [Bacteroidales bacterium]|nr:hypothetical protein [Bacteroidales bacterium]MDD4713099.1 hypothetical protein [Bacteroidales bacterium]